MLSLAGRLGEWLLLPELANGIFRKRVSEAKQPLRDALDTLKRAIDKHGFTAFDLRVVDLLQLRVE